MKTREELIKQCRYYKGEERNPFEDFPLSWFWEMERVYVRSEGELFPMSNIYKAINGKSYTEIPFSLLIVMFTSWGKYAYDIENEINNFYKIVDEYLSMT